MSEKPENVEVTLYEQIKRDAEEVAALVGGTVTEYPPRKKITTLYHQDADGFGAAYAIWKHLKDTCDLSFIPVQYGQDPPYEQLAELKPDKLYIVDFSYKAPVLRELNALYPDMTVFDHHKTALPELKDWVWGEGSVVYRDSEDDSKSHCVKPGEGSYFFDQNLSGCGLVWEMFSYKEHIDEESGETFGYTEPLPDILCYVQDRDLWKFELEHSKEINAFIATLDWDFEVWDSFYTPEAYDAGKAILKFQQNQIDGRMKDVVLRLFISEVDEGVVVSASFIPVYLHDVGLDPTDLIPTLNASENISEIGNRLCELYPDAPFSMTYCDRADGMRSYSLRSSNGFDVSAVAKAFGGGGHAAAAGFSRPSPDII